MAKVSLPDEAVTYDAASQLGGELDHQGQFEEAKEFYLAALEGYRRVPGEEHKDTLMLLNITGVLLLNTKDYEGALDYFQEELRVLEKVVGKNYPDTLLTIMNIAAVFMDGLRDLTKEEEMSRLALDGYKKSLGKDHEGTKKCAENMAQLLGFELEVKENTQQLLHIYPHLLDAQEWTPEWYHPNRDDDPFEIAETIQAAAQH